MEHSWIAVEDDLGGHQGTDLLPQGTYISTALCRGWLGQLSAPEGNLSSWELGRCIASRGTAVL